MYNCWTEYSNFVDSPFMLGGTGKRWGGGGGVGVEDRYGVEDKYEQIVFQNPTVEVAYYSKALKILEPIDDACGYFVRGNRLPQPNLQSTRYQVCIRQLLLPFNKTQ